MEDEYSQIYPDDNLNWYRGNVDLQKDCCCVWLLSMAIIIRELGRFEVGGIPIQTTSAAEELESAKPRN